ncbi:MAG: hypothetical protein MJZ40_01025 [Bacteroidaceae bacterium]|nr:hypothetical protein [Bacteroidaceae bacterium]
MKKLLLLAAVLLGSLNIVAQTSEDWGYGSTDVSTMPGLGNGQTGTFGVAMELPVSSVLDGASITSISVPFNQTSVKELKVFISTSTDFNKPVVTASFTGTIKKGFNDVELPEPYALAVGKKVYVGYTFIQTAKSSQQEQYPLLLASYNTPNGLWLSVGGSWEDYSSKGYGCSAMRVKLANVKLKDYDVTLTSATSQTSTVNTDASISVGLISSSAKAINSISYTVSCDGQTYEKEAKANVASGLNKIGNFTASVPTGKEGKDLKYTLTINKLNGEAVTPTSIEGKITVVTRQAKRLSVVEEFTGTGCGFCPRGWVGMGILKEEMADKAAVIAIHQYNSNDPMYTTEYATPRFEGAPSCIIDRKGGECDPFYGPNDEGIKAYTEAVNASSMPEVDMKLTAAFSSDMKTVTAKASTEFLTDLKGSSIVFVLTADGLTGTSASWKQSNYFVSYTAAEAGGLGTGLADFCKGGKYAQSTVTLVYDDVLLTSSWNSGGSVNRAPAFSTTATGAIEQSNYTLTIPTKTTLKAALKYDQLYVTAFVLKADGTVANAVRCKVELPEYAATLSLATYPATEVGAKATANATIQNYGTQTVNKVGYRYRIQSIRSVGSGVSAQKDTVYTEPVDGEAILTEPLKGGEFGSTTFPVEVVAPQHVSSSVSTDKLTNYVMVAITSLNDTKLDENNLTYATAVIRTVPVGIETVVNSNLNDNLDRYDLQGRRTKAQQRGITLERGLKVIR